MCVDGKWNVWNYEWILWMGVKDDELNEMKWEITIVHSLHQIYVFNGIINKHQLALLIIMLTNMVLCCCCCYWW